ncbi:MAG: flagellar biosynthesis protein FlhA [Deltaproteobacteria bacterium]|nr:flagellar biosynthesis protein FlhA [Deltaproteobacteria bacterium]
MENVLTWVRGKSDLIIATSVVVVILIMIVPLNPFFIDMFISLSISTSLMILLMGMYTQRPLDFSVFPSILLIVTLFRLSLNIASTRLILLHGDEGAQAAGRIIKAFGTFIIGGNYVVGAIVFLILIIINFVVITKGAGRVAEVAARFTLDAMPGKQMSIDADLNAGLIDDMQAKERRARIEMEADFYGAMDGASKFVRGDAIAGVIIIFVNLIGGFVIGVVQKGMSMTDALSVYTILTIGDGLVSQIPALLTSTAAGIIVTRAAGESNLGRDVVTQFTNQPRAMVLASVILICVGMVPGIPAIPFLILASVTAGAGYVITKAQREEALKLPEVPADMAEKAELVQPVDALEIEIGYGLIPIVDTDQSGELLDKLKAIRKQLAGELGVVIPPIKVRDNLQLKAGEYAIFIKGVEMGKGELLLGHLLAMGADDQHRIPDAIPTREPVFNLDASWVKEKDRDRYTSDGFTIVDHATVIATHLTEILRNNAHELMARQEVQKLLDTISTTHQKVVEELTQNGAGVGVVQKVLQNLLREQVSIRDLATILETIADYAMSTKDPDVLTEFVRQRMARSILKQYLVDGMLHVLIFEKALEEKLISSVQTSEQGTYLALDLSFTQQLIDKIGNEVKNMMVQNIQPVILVHPIIRGKLRRLLERYIQGITVISHNEIPQQIKIKSAGVIKAHEG